MTYLTESYRKYKFLQWLDKTMTELLCVEDAHSVWPTKVIITGIQGGVSPINTYSIRGIVRLLSAHSPNNYEALIRQPSGSHRKMLNAILSNNFLIITDDLKQVIDYIEIPFKIKPK